MWRRIVVLVLIVIAVGLWAWPRSGRQVGGVETRQPAPVAGGVAAASSRPGSAIPPPVAQAQEQAEEAVLPAAVLDRPEGPLTVQLVRRAGGRREPIRIEDQQGRRREMAGDHLLITPRAGVDRAQLAAAVARTGAHLRRQVGRTRSWLAAFPVASHEDLPRQRLALAAQPEIAAVEDDGVVRALCTPDDPRFGEQWSLRNTGQEGGTVGADIDADGAWSVTTGDARVLVGVIDSGIDFSHPDLAPNRWTNPGETGLDSLGRDKRANGVDDDGNGYIDDWRGWDFVADDNDPADENGHGTHCAGVIGARGGDATGIAGIAWRTSLVGLRFLDAGGSGLNSDAIAAIDYATRIGCSLTSNSWGGSATSAALRDAILANPAPFVAAAGNSATNNDATPQYPASYDCPSIIAVAATTRTDALAGFSCFGAASVDLGAPGDSILSSVPGGWQVKSGTSMAAPHVTGVLALMRAAAPERDAASLKAALLAATDPIAALRGRCVSGGRLNAARALDAVAGVMVVVEAQAQAEEGDGDGVFEPGEAVAIRLTLRSSGALAAPGVTGTLVLDGATDTVEAATVTWGDIAAGTSLAAPQPFRVRLAATTTARVVSGTITLSEAGGRTWPCPVSFPAAPGGLLRVRVQDAAGTALAGATVRWDGLATGAAPSTTQAVAGWPNCLRQLPTGTYQVSASAAGYAPAGPLTVAVPVMGLTPVLTLTRPRMVVSPLSLALTAPAGGATSASLRIDNPGDGPLDVTAAVVGQPAMTATGLWHRSTRRTADGGLAWWYGREADGSYGGATASGTLTSAPFALSFPILSFSTWRSVEADPARDRLLVEASGDGGRTWATIATVTGTTTAWQPQSAYLFAFRPGQLVQVRFTAQVRDDQPRTGEGWFVDAIQSSYGAIIDPWLEIAASARVPAGGSVLLPVLAGLDTGFSSRTATVRLTGSDPLLPALDIPVTLSRILVPALTLTATTVSEVAGDGDGALEPGETGGVAALLRNGGEAIARGVSATMATTSPWATVTRGSATCADIAVGGSQYTGRFELAVAAGCPVGTIIPLTFTAQDDGGRSWSMSATAAVVRRCRLSGTVTSAADGSLCDSAYVQLTGPASTYTFAFGGRYQVNGLVPGLYQARFSKGGYAPRTYAIDVQDDTVLDAALSPSTFVPTPAAVTMTVLPGGSASAAIVATAGGPIPVEWTTWSGTTWLTMQPSSGITAPGATAAITLHASAVGRSPGRYTGLCSLRNDSAGGSSEMINVVLNVGTPPQALPTTAATSEDTPVTFTLAASDPGGDALTATITRFPNGGTIAVSGLSCTYTPSAEWSGTDSLRFTVSDGVFTSAEAVLTVIVAPVDDPIAGRDLTLLARPGMDALLYLPGVDPDSSVSWSVLDPPTAGSATLAGTRLTYRTSRSQAGSDRLVLGAVSESGSATCAVAVTIADPPSADQLTVQVRSNDPRLITLPGTARSGGTLSSLILTQPLHGVLSAASGVERGWVYQPERDFLGDDQFVFAITESGSPSAPATAAITVVSAPAVPGKLVAPDGAPGDRFGAAVALEGDLAVVGAPLAAPSGKAYVFQRQGDGSWLRVRTLVSGDARVERFGTGVALQGRFLVVAGCLRGGEAVAVVYQGGGSGWMPTASINTGSAGAASVRERGVSLALDGGLLAVGTPYAGTGAVSLYRFGDPGWNPVARLAGSFSQRDFGYSVSLSGERVLVGVPYGWSPWYGGASIWAGPGWTREAILHAEVFDGAGGKAVALRGDTAVVAVPGYSNSSGSLEIWQRIAGAWCWSHRLVNPGWSDGSDWDQFGSALAWDGTQMLASAPYLWQADVGASGAVAHLRLSDGGRLSHGTWWRADDAAYGDWAASALAVQGKRRLIGVELDDANGVDSGAAYLFDRDDPPRVAVAATATTAEDTALTIPATTSDPDGDATTLVVVGQPAHGSVTVVGGAVVYQPAADWSGEDAIVLAAHDGAQAGASATVAVTVTPVNDAPTVRAAALATDEDAALVFLPEAADVDGDTLAFAVQQAPAHGSLVIDGAQVRYQPAADWNGSDSFALVASDGRLTGTPAVFTITVRPVDDPPMVADASVATDEDQPVTVPFAVADADGGDPPILVLASPPAHGQCRIDGLGVVYIPESDWNGSDSFAVVALSGALTSLPATAAVTVNPVDDPAQPATGAWTVDEDTVLAIAPVLTDIDGGPACELAVVVAPAHGSARVEGQTVVYQPAADWHGEDVLLVAAGIAGRWSASATQAITVRAVDDPPVVSATAAATAEDMAVSVEVVVSDMDGGAPPTLALASPPAHGLCRIEGLDVVYTPEADWNGSDSFALVALSGALTSAPATVAVTVLPVDDPAQPATGAWTVDEDTLLTITPVLVDPDGGPVCELAVVVAPAHGSARVEGRTVVYQPLAGWHGEDVLLVAAGIAGRWSASSTQAITVRAVDDPPVVSATSAVTAEDMAVSVEVVVSDMDGGAPPTLALASPPAHGQCRIDGLGVVYTPAADWNGSDSFALVALSGALTSAPATVAVTVLAVDDPAQPATGAWTVDEDTVLVIAPVLTDIDGGPACELSVVVAPAHGSARVDGRTVVYQPAADWHGEDVLLVAAGIAGRWSASATQAITVRAVNDDPVLADFTVETDEDAPVLIPLPDRDADGDPLTVAAMARSGSVAIAGMRLTYQPRADWHGEDLLTVTLSDGQGGSAAATVTVRVRAVNDAPELRPSALRTSEDQAVNGLVLGSDADGDPLTPVLVRQPRHGRVVLGGGMAFTYTPDPDWNGTDAFALAVGDGRLVSAPAEFSVLVDPVADAPTVAGMVVSTGEDVAVDIPLVAHDADGDALTAIVVRPPVHGTVVLAGLVATFHPAQDWNGSDDFAVVVSDGVLGSRPATIQVLVAPGDDPPVLADATLTTDEDQPAVIRLPAVDRDDDPLSVAEVRGPAHGALDRDGLVLTYRPAADWHGDDAVVVVVADGKGGQATATMSLHVRPVNDAPVMAGAILRTREDEAVSFDVQGADADGDVLAVVVVRAPAHGRIEAGAWPQVVYRPDPDWNGTDTFALAASDGLARSAAAETTVTVEAVADAPRLADAVLDALSGVPLTTTMAASDPDGDAVSVRIEEPPAHGSATMAGLDLTYRADRAWMGDDRLVLVVSDGQGLEARAAVVVHVHAPGTLPVLFAVDMRTDEDVPVRQQVGALDPAGGTVAVVLGDAPAHGQVEIAGQQVTYRPQADWAGEDLFTLVPVASATGAAVPVRVGVAPVNDPPVIAVSADPLAVVAGGSARVEFQIGDPDHAAALLTMAVTLEDGWIGVPVLRWEGGDGRRTLVVGAPAGMVGEASIRVVVTDPAGARAAATCRVLVEAAPVGPATGATTAATGSAGPVSTVPTALPLAGGGGAGGCGLGGLGIAILALGAAMAGRRRRR